MAITYCRFKRGGLPLDLQKTIQKQVIQALEDENNY